MDLSIKDIVRAIKGELVLGDPKGIAKRACIDSRSLKPGDLFFALKGEKSDGHEFVGLAVREGAVGLVVSHLKWMENNQKIKAAVIRVPSPEGALQALGRTIRTHFKGPVVGITGSNGKTTTKQMVKSILKTQGPGLATVGNFNSQIGLPLVLSEIEKKDKWMVLEMGATEPGHISKLCDIAKPTIGILTGLGPAHLATFGSMERVAESKWELMDSLPAAGTAILPWGLPLLEPHIRRFRKKIVFFGENSACPVRASSVEIGETIKFMLHVGPTSSPLRLPVSGRFNVGNALAAAAVGHAMGFSIEKIVQGLEKFEPPSMRMELRKHESGAVLINDAYNANPTSMLESIRSLVETYPNKKRTVILGSMLELGKDSDRWHFHVGSEIRHFDLKKIFLVGKEMEQVQNGAITAGAKKDKFILIEDPKDLVSQLQSYLEKDSVLLFKGSRGMGLEKIIEKL